MVDIVRINSTGNNQINRVTDRPAAKSTEAGSAGTSNSAPQTDTINIGAGAREATTVQNLVALAQAEPNVRTDAVAAAKEKLANGEFNTRAAFEGAAKGILGIS